jgi:pilin isopeptide linkage protein
MTEGSKTLEELMPGEYRVEESNQFFDGYTCATTYQVGIESRQKVDLTADGAAISVTNTYTKNTVKQALSVKKEVTGNDYTGDEDFSFTLAKAEGSTASTDLLPEDNDVSAKNGQTASFGEITFEEPGTYYYTITEAAGTTDGMSYSSSPRYAKVVIDWNADKTAPVVTSIAYGDSKEAVDAASASDTLTVANTYAKTTAEINVSKEVKGDSNYAPAEDFTLTVTLEDYTTPKGGNQSAAGLMICSDPAATGTNMVYATSGVIDTDYYSHYRLAEGSNSSKKSMGTRTAGDDVVLRLTRTGSKFEAAYSTDGGATFTVGKSDSFAALSEEVYVGLAVSSGDNSKSATAKFSQMRIDGTEYPFE